MQKNLLGVMLAAAVSVTVPTHAARVMDLPPPESSKSIPAITLRHGEFVMVNCRDHLGRAQVTRSSRNRVQASLPEIQSGRHFSILACPWSGIMPNRVGSDLYTGEISLSRGVYNFRGRLLSHTPTLGMLILNCGGEIPLFVVPTVNGQHLVAFCQTDLGDQTRSGSSPPRGPVPAARP